ncbi:MAG: hypothetical protein PVS3B3_34930 [Ktedonobacteraceae bacterium]
MYANDGNTHAKPFDDEVIPYDDLELDDEPSHPLALYGHRLFQRLGVKVVRHPVLEEEEENDECEFDIRMTDVPDDVLATTNTEPDLLEVRLAAFGKKTWQHTPHKRLLTWLALLLLLVLLISITLFGHTSFNLFPLSSMQPQATQIIG